MHKKNKEDGFGIHKDAGILGDVPVKHFAKSKYKKLVDGKEVDIHHPNGKFKFYF